MSTESSKGSHALNNPPSEFEVNNCQRNTDIWYPSNDEDFTFVRKVVEYVFSNGKWEGYFQDCIFEHYQPWKYDFKLRRGEYAETPSISSFETLPKENVKLSVFKCSRSGSGNTPTIDMRIPGWTYIRLRAKTGSKNGSSSKMYRYEDEPKLVNINRFMYNAFHYLRYLGNEAPQLNGGNSQLDVSHLCDVNLCMNPKHLILETRKKNMERQRCKGYIHYKCGAIVRVCDHGPDYCTRVTEHTEKLSECVINLSVFNVSVSKSSGNKKHWINKIKE